MEDFDPFLLGRTMLGVRFGNAFLENLNVKTGGSTAQGIGRVMEYRRKRLRPRKKNSRTFDAGEAKENKLGLILPKLGFAPEPLGSRYVYRPKVLAPNPQSPIPVYASQGSDLARYHPVPRNRLRVFILPAGAPRQTKRTGVPNHPGARKSGEY
jgi:hypothetical protein